MNHGNDWLSYFDRVVLINLARRPDRLERFQRYVDQVNWPFADIEVFPAIDGDKVGVSSRWKTGGGSWGCMRSHTRILEQALMEDVSSILLLEDDAYFPRPGTFRQEIIEFLAQVPDDWDALMLGGQHVGRDGTRPPEPVKPGIVRCYDCERTHAYALRGAVIGELYRLWCSIDEHIDWHMGPFLGKSFHTYAPDPFLIGQDQGRSDISGRTNGRQNWSRGNPDDPVILLHAPRSVVEELRPQGWHGGYDRNDRGIDTGLDRILQGHISPHQQQRELRHWLELIQGEVAAIGPQAIAMIWDPTATAGQLETVRRACGKTVMEIHAETAAEAIRQRQGRRAA